MAESRDVVVVGGGLAGLVAATRLVAAGRSVRVLEARPRVGGRTYSVPFAGGVIDLGGQWLGPTQDRAYALARELGVATFAQHTRGRRILERNGDVRTYRGTVPPLPLLESVQAGLTIATLELLARTVSLATPWRGRLAAHWDKISVADWLGRHTRGGGRALAELATQMIFCAEPRDLSFLYFLYYLRGGGGLLRLSEAEGGAQQDRLTGGVQQLSDKLAARLDVRLEAPVRRIVQDGAGVTVEAEGVTVTATRAIVAVPPALAAKIVFDPELPAARRDLHENMPMGSVVKVVVAYPRAFWRERDLTGEAVSLGWPCRAWFDDCAAGGEHPALVGFVVGDAARRFGALSEAERKEAVAAQLGALFGDDARRFTAYVDHDWVADPWSAGCYVGVLGPGVLTRVGPALRAPAGRIHFAGTETATVWAGYIEGAIESGERAAAEVVASMSA